MPTPYELAQHAEQLCAEHRLHDAERAFQQAIQAYEREGEDLAFVLGRLGACYEQNNEIERAIETYYRAIRLGTDIPAIYGSLIDLLVKGGQQEEAFSVADQWNAHSQPTSRYTAHRIFINLGEQLMHDNRFEEAIELLSRTVEAISVRDFPTSHWEARGTLALALEKSGDVDAAMKMRVAAIQEGSDDRNTYTRYVMYLERQTRYEEALGIIKQALKVQRDAAWEVDFRMRQQRIERKAGKVAKNAAPAVIPCFSVRRGATSVSLLYQIEFSPQIIDLVISQSRVIYAVSGGRTPTLSAWQLDSATMVWQASLPERARGILYAQDGVVTYAQEGRIGAGAGTLHFFDLAGQAIASHRLPDVLTDVVTDGNSFYAGCRDGRLYAFSAQGRMAWSYEVPRGKEQPDTGSIPLCPYYVSAAANLVVFSSFSDVFALDGLGRLRWQWSAPDRTASAHSAGVTLTLSFGTEVVTGLFAVPDGTRVMVTTGDAIYELVGGKINSEFREKGKTLHRAAVDITGTIWVVSADDQVLVLRNQGLAGCFAALHGAYLRLNSDADRLLAWASHKLWVANLASRVIAEVEFAKPIASAHCTEDGRLIVGAGHLVVLHTAVQSGVTPSRTAKE